MAKSRSRKQSITNPLRAPISPANTKVTAGRYPTTGTSLKTSQRPLQVLPKLLPSLLPEVIRQVREISPSWTYDVRRQQPATKRQPGRLLPKLAAQRQLRKLREVPAPIFRAQRTPCDIRKDRRSVMFAAGVAGKKWTRGGPNMLKARHTINSEYKCG